MRVSHEAGRYRATHSPRIHRFSAGRQAVIRCRTDLGRTTQVSSTQEPLPLATHNHCILVLMARERSCPCPLSELWHLDIRQR